MRSVLKRKVVIEVCDKRDRRICNVLCVSRQLLNHASCYRLWEGKERPLYPVRYTEGGTRNSSAMHVGPSPVTLHRFVVCVCVCVCVCVRGGVMGRSGGWRSLSGTHNEKQTCDEHVDGTGT